MERRILKVKDWRERRLHRQLINKIGGVEFLIKRLNELTQEIIMFQDYQNRKADYVIVNPDIAKYIEENERQHRRNK